MKEMYVQIKWFWSILMLIFLFFGYISHFLAPLETANIAIKKYYQYYIIDLINTLCKGMAWLPFQKFTHLALAECLNHVTIMSQSISRVLWQLQLVLSKKLTRKILFRPGPASSKGERLLCLRKWVRNSVKAMILQCMWQKRYTTLHCNINCRQKKVTI